ncbi:unnamed protein product [Allacma fusca]|uniref:Endothelin-converting enzyme 1 n=1 Tax=Allacma fusca TaxID=39272 RepID=A0A8J2KTM1_9HEXA|nr:unnamed protein product [Allacma fusca]
MANFELIVSSLIGLLDLLVFSFNGAGKDSVINKEKICHSKLCENAASAIKTSIDVSINPCDNFYDFACGKWIQHNPIPPGEVQFGQLEKRMKVLNGYLQEILSSPDKPQDSVQLKRAKDFYGDCIDTGKMNSRGLTPLISLIEALGGWPLIGNWGGEFKLSEVLYKTRGILNNGRMSGAARQGILFSIYAASEQEGVRPKAIFLNPPSLFMSLEVLNDLEGESHQEKVQATRNFMKGVILEIKAAMNEPIEDETLLDESIDKVIEFESELADSIADVNTMFVQTSYLTIEDFQSSYFANRSLNSWAQIDWQSLLNQYFSSKAYIDPSMHIVLFQPNYFENLQTIVSDTSVETITNYIIWRVVAALVTETTDNMRELQFRYAQESLGLTEPFKRSKTCAEAGADKEARYYYWGYAIVSEYTSKYFSPENRHHMSSMVNYIREALLKLIEESQWLSLESKETVGFYARQMEQSVAYADWTTNSTALDEFYHGLELLGKGHHFENHVSFRNWQVDKELEKLGIPVSQVKTDLSPLDIQAHFDGSKNMMVFTAGIAGPPFYYSADAPAFLNFATMGHIISHELTHSFYGTIDQHVTPTAEEFHAKGQIDTCVRQSYFGLEGSNEIYNGTHWTLEEDNADVGGIHMAYSAYKNWLAEHAVEDKILPGLEEFTPHQLFFLSMAQMWCENVNASSIRKIILREAHAPGRFRALGPLMNSAYFTQAWNCPLNSGMNPTEKCGIW